MKKIQSFEVANQRLTMQPDEATVFTVAVGASMSSHVQTIAWPYLDKDVRAIITKLNDAGLPPAGVTVYAKVPNMQD